MSDIKNSQTKQEKILQFLKAFEEIEESIRPFAESRKDLRKSFIENEWLTKEEIKSTIQAYRIAKKRENINELSDIYDLIKKEILPDEEE
ncbi:MAG: hypothetical protein HC875_33620 [Anaerolineales bacterium]|nr:hypothetical protein [Anaerolineales bacterium]